MDFPNNLPPWLPLGILCLLAVYASVNIWLRTAAKTSHEKPSEPRPSSSSPSKLPDGWWSDPVRFQAERRAIFSQVTTTHPSIHISPSLYTFPLPLSTPHKKKSHREGGQTWLCVSHRGRFHKPGDYVVHHLAGFRFFLILGKDHTVRAFHNVCRHRAFPVARKQAGSATVLGCRYHGWSYDTRGALVKAPYFDGGGVPGFDRARNGLYGIRTWQDGLGFLHVNISRQGGEEEEGGVASRSPPPPPPPEGRMAQMARMAADSRFVDSMEFGAKFNWKVTREFGPAFLPCCFVCVYVAVYWLLLTRKAVKPDSGFVPAEGTVRWFSTTTRGSTPAGELVFFPLTTVHTMPGRPFWYQLTFSPDAVEQTGLRCDVYSTGGSADVKFEGTAKDALKQELEHKLQVWEQKHEVMVSSGYSMAEVNGMYCLVCSWSEELNLTIFV